MTTEGTTTEADMEVDLEAVMEADMAATNHTNLMAATMTTAASEEVSSNLVVYLGHLVT